MNETQKSLTFIENKASQIYICLNRAFACPGYWDECLHHPVNCPACDLKAHHHCVREVPAQHPDFQARFSVVIFGCSLL